MGGRLSRGGAEVGVAGVLGASADVGVEGPGSRAEPAAVGAGEGELPVGVALDGPAAFVDEVVVFPAEAGEVAGVGGPASGPVLDVVEVADPALAAGEPAGSVSVGEASAQPARRGAPGAADADAGAVGSVDAVVDLAVAEQPPDGVDGDRDALDRTVALRGAVDDVGVDVHDHDGGVGTGVGEDVVAGELDEGVGAAGALGAPDPGGGVLADSLGPLLEGGVEEAALLGGEEPLVSPAVACRGPGAR